MQTFVVTKPILEQYLMFRDLQEQIKNKCKFWVTYSKRSKTYQIFFFSKTGPYNIRVKAGDVDLKYAVYKGTIMLYETNRIDSILKFKSSC